MENSYKQAISACRVLNVAADTVSSGEREREREKEMSVSLGYRLRECREGYASEGGPEGTTVRESNVQRTFRRDIGSSATVSSRPTVGPIN